jgi:hypothetical protein
MNPMTDTWTTFGRDQGQIVERSYRYDPASDRIVCRTLDRSDNSTTYEAMPFPDGAEWNGSEGVSPWSASNWEPCDNPFSRHPNP